MGCLVATLVTPVGSSPAQAAALVSPYIVYVGHGVALVAAQTPSGCDKVFLSSDLVHWSNLSARLPRRARCYFWDSASFVSRRTGWILGRNAGSEATVLLHTTDGGLVWRSQPGSSTGSNGGFEAIGFANRFDGWRQQVAYGASGPFLLEHTTDGGWTWTSVATTGATGCQYLPDVFATNELGYAANGFVSTPTQTGGFWYPWLWQSRDAGAAWTRHALPRAVGVGAASVALVGTPTFEGAHGGVPVVYLVGRREVVAIDQTGDNGRGWRHVAQLTLTGTVRADAPGPCPHSRTVTDGWLATVEGATPLDWWVLHPPAGPRQRTELFHLEHKGHGWVTIGTVARNLPVWSQGRDGVALWALTARRALVTLQGDGYTTLYRTTDGGRDWVPISLAG